MKKICVFFLALAVFLLPEMVYAANATPQAVNMPHVYIVFGVLFVAAVLFFTEWIPLAVTSILVPCALSTLGVITVKEAWVSFGDTSILTIVGVPRQIVLGIWASGIWWDLGGSDGTGSCVKLVC